jgi:redox-sensitive bicupin YhaK (pirin superfamily)
MKLRKSNERGYFENEWLKSFHTFSFGEYYDPKNLHYSDLRVINHDFVAPASGFGMHPHKDMEIISYVLRGQVEHQDSMGNKKIIKAGEVQTMSAGRGVLHSEYNPDDKNEFELIQIWILPNARALAPAYDQKQFSREDRRNKLQLLVSNDRRQGSLMIHQDASLSAAILDPGKKLLVPLRAGRKYWLQVAQGELKLKQLQLSKGDGVAIAADELSDLSLEAVTESEILLFDLQNQQ